MSQDDIYSLKNASAIIERFGGIRPMAAKVGAPVTTVQGWKKRDVIPGSRRDDVLKAANENNIDISDLAAGSMQRETVSVQSAPYIPARDAMDDLAGDENKDNIKISVEPIMRPQPKTFPSSFTTSIDTTHEDLMAAIAKGQKKAVRASLWTATAFVLLLGGAAAAFMWPSVQKIETHDEQIASLEGKVGAMDKDVQAMNESAGSIKDMVPDDIRTKLDALKAQADNISGEVQTVAKQAQDISKTVLGSDAGSLSDRLSVLEAKLGEVQGGEAMQDLVTRIRGLEASVGGQTQIQDSVNELSRIVDSLDGQVNGLTNELSDVRKAQGSPLGQTLEGISDNDLKAAAMLIAFSQLRDSLNRNAPFEDDVVLLQKLVGDDNPELRDALARLAPQAEKGGVLTREGLSEEFKGLGGDIVFASLKGEDVSVADKAKVRLTQMMNIKKDGQVVGGTPTQQAVAKAQKQLDSGDVQGAIATLNGLEGGAATQAAPFIQQAQATVLADQIQTMLRQMIVANVGSKMPIATTGAAPVSVQSVTDQIQAVIPGQAVVQDKESGFEILPAPKGFKGFSSVPQQ